MLNWTTAIQTLKNAMLVVLMSASIILPACADYVGELETTKYFDQQSIAMMQSRIASNQPLTPNDEVSYFIQFTPTDNGGMVGGGGFVTDYIPAGMVVTGAQFVRLDGSGGYSQIAPPGVAAMLPAYVPEYSETGIFYSTDPRTAVYTAPASTTITAANGYALGGGTGCGGISMPSTTHNTWDSAMQTAYVKAARNKNGTCAANPVVTAAFNPALTVYPMGASPVAGPDVLLQIDAAGAVGPWQRIAYPGSKKGTMTGVASYGKTNACIGGTPTSAGYSLSSTNPLPPNTNAVRFAAGKVTVGELFTVRISMRPTANTTVGSIINNSEVFGGDASLDPGSKAGKDNHWKYHCPAVAISNGNLMLVKTLVGACVGVACVPTAVTAGVVPAAANLKLRYKIQYLNLGTVAQTNVVLNDTFAAGAAYVAASYVALTGTTPAAPTFAAGTLSFPAIASLAPGAGGELQYDVNFAAAPRNKAALINTANMTSTQIPVPGVTSKSIATATTAGNLWITKSTSTSSVAPGGSVAYTINIPNNGGAAVVASAATPITISDFLPTAGIGTLVTDRFSYNALSAVTAQIISAAGVATAVTPTVTVVAPATPTAAEKVVFTFTAGSIPMGGRLVINYGATVGANVPSSATPYLSDVNVWYSGGPGGAAANSSYSEDIGTAPVTVTAPMTLSLKIDCVYAGASCVTYTNGTIPPNSKVRYRADYKNISALALSAVALTDTLPANTSYVAGSAQRDGVAIADPSIAGQVLTFSSATTLAAAATGYVAFDVQLGAGVTDGLDITNTAKITATSFPAGVTASVTHSVRNQAQLQVSKTVSPATAQAGGQVTYVLTVSNIGSVSAKNIKLFDILPDGGAVSVFAYNVPVSGGGYDVKGFKLTGTAASTITSVTPTTVAPPTLIGYTGQTNRQQILWTFAAAQTLAAGESFSIQYVANVAATVADAVTAYTSDVGLEYISATVPPSSIKHAWANNVAGVTIGGLDHLRITHTGQGLTCEAESLKVDSCADATCTKLFTGTVTATFNGAAAATTFTGGTTTISLSQLTAGTVTLGATGISPTPRNTTPVSCTDGTTASCDIKFVDAALILTASANGSETMISEPQIAGKQFADSLGAATSYYLRAVKTDKVTKACVSAVSALPMPATVNLGFECNDPSSCAGNNLSVNGSAVQGNSNGGNIFGNYAYTGVALSFDANGNGTTALKFSYEDVGQITLRMHMKAGGADLFGNSNSFKVRPDHFAVDVCNAATANGNGDCAYGTGAAAIDGSGNVLAIAGTAAAQAGTSFYATVRAMTANNNVAPSFGTAVGGTNGAGVNVNTLEKVTLIGNCAAPIIGAAVNCPAAGALNGTTSFARSAFGNNGTATVSDLTWSEVGAITLTAADSTFMSVASGASGTSAVAGRFRPDHFVTVATGTLGCATPTPFAACPAGNMVYSGQNFAAATITAMNAAGATTANYQGVFAKATTLSAVDAAGTALANGVLANTAVAKAAYANGVAAIPAATAPIFTLADFNSLDVYLHATDGEATSVGGNEGGLKVISGRILIGNAYGSELMSLNMTATAQFFDGGRWWTSITDSATTLTLAANYNVTKGGVVGGVTVPAVVGATPLVNGVLQIGLGAPGVAGVAAVAPGVPAYLPLTAGAATFGVYKGGNQFIFQREAY